MRCLRPSEGDHYGQTLTLQRDPCNVKNVHNVPWQRTESSSGKPAPGMFDISLVQANSRACIQRTEPALACKP